MSSDDHNSKEIDELSGTQTTGHEWDGIKELDTPLPRWWVWTFYATIIFSIGYVIYYPAIPLIETSTVATTRAPFRTCTISATPPCAPASPTRCWISTG